MGYKKQYFKLFNTITDTISTLQTLAISIQLQIESLKSVQLSCEDDLIESDDDSTLELESDE